MTITRGQVSPPDFAYTVGQIVGSNLACGATRDRMMPIAAKAFKKLNTDVTEGNDNHQRFVSGIADGVEQMKSGAATCDDVRAGLEQFREKL